MKKLLSLLMLVALLGGMTFAQKKTDLTAKVPVDKKVRIGHLDNGLTYYIRANKMPENRIQFRMVTNAGSILEDEAQRGLAHFCEHMAFNGIEGLPHNQMIDTLQKNGIEFGRGINAYTSFDETVYYVDMPADNPEMVTMGLTILNGWCGGLLFDPQELEDERGVIHEEWRGNLGAQERLREKTWPIMLNNSRYAYRLPIGLESVIMGFKRNDIVRFYKDWYRPDMQAVIIVGDIADVDAMEARVKDIFGKHAKAVNPKQRPVFDIPDNKAPLVAIATDKEATSTSIMMFWKHKKPAHGTVGDYRASLVRNVVSNMLDERFNELNEKAESPFMSSGAGYGGFIGRVNDAFMGNATPKEGRIEEATQVVLSEIFRAVQHGFLQTELDRVKEDILDHYRKMAKEANKTNSNNLAGEYTNHFLEGEVIPGIMTEFKYAKEFIPEITLEECNALIKTWVTEENFTYVLQAPEVKVPTEQQILDIYNTARTANYEPWVDSYKDEPLWTKELPAVTANVTKENKALGYTEYTLPNGIRFIVKKTDLKEDEIQMNSYAWGGCSLYEDADAYAAQSAAGIIDNAGISSFSSNDLSKKLKGMTVGITPSISENTQGFSGSCSPKDLETMLQLLNLYYEAPRKDLDAFNRDMDNLRNQLKFVASNPRVAFLLKYREVAYPNDKRTVMLPTEEQINSLSLDREYNIFRERFCDASNQTFFFVGNVNDDAVKTIAKYLNNLPCNGKQKAETWKDRHADFAKGIQHAEVRKGTDNQGIMIMYGETKGFKSNKKDKMIVNQLSDAMEITALEVIREKMGGTYSPSVQISYDIEPDGTGSVSWMFYINCNPEMSQAIEDAALSIINGYLKNGPDAVTLNKVQEQMIINRGTARQNNGFWMGQIMGSYMYNENRDDIDQYDALVKSVSAKDIKKMAKKFINLKNYVVVNLKPEAAPAE
ncbi:MAG: insulinase family protein [Bacteroidales bacterium]|nr:insulinase family protein [Bacteroidales bacterium]